MVGALLAFYAFVIGALVGSFLNVVIYRYPREQSVMNPPRSYCPSCGATIRWYDNIPILSYLALRGRCRRCGEGISSRYPLVELANALFYMAIYLRVGMDVVFIPLAAIVSMTIVLIYIDLDIQILPDVIDLPGIAIGIWIGAMSVDRELTNLFLATSWIDSAAGAAFGAGIILLISLVYKLIRRIEGMGQGDIKMMAMIGAVVGWKAVVPVLLLASLSGSIFGIAMAIRTKTNLQVALPFGVFLGLAFLLVMFFGNAAADWMPYQPPEIG